MARFKKGQSGNPGGRSKKQKEIAQYVRDLVEVDGRNLALEGLWDIAQNAKRDIDRLKAFELLTAYGYGKPSQQIQHSTDPENPVKVNIYLPDNGR